MYIDLLAVARYTRASRTRLFSIAERAAAVATVCRALFGWITQRRWSSVLILWLLRPISLSLNVLAQLLCLAAARRRVCYGYKAHGKSNPFSVTEFFICLEREPDEKLGSRYRNIPVGGFYSANCLQLSQPSFNTGECSDECSRSW